MSKIFLSLFSFSVIFASLAYISRSEELNISKIEIIGNKIIDASAVKIVVEKEIAGHYFWFFPKANILIYPKNSIKQELYNKFQKLKEVNLYIKERKTVEVYVSEREGKYVWCKNSSISEQCYFLDDSGYIFGEAPYFSGEVYFKFYGPADIGTYFLEENFRQLIYFRDFLTAKGIKSISLSVLENKDAKISLTSANKSLKEPYIIFKINSDFQKIAENFETALDTEPLMSNFKNKYSSLEYIDLRFGDKVYYKFK